MKKLKIYYLYYLIICLRMEKYISASGINSELSEGYVDKNKNIKKKDIVNYLIKWLINII